MNYFTVSSFKNNILFILALRQIFIFNVLNEIILRLRDPIQYSEIKIFNFHSFTSCSWSSMTKDSFPPPQISSMSPISLSGRKGLTRKVAAKNPAPISAWNAIVKGLKRCGSWKFSWCSNIWKLFFALIGDCRLNIYCHQQEPRIVFKWFLNQLSTKFSAAAMPRSYSGYDYRRILS